ncbi:uncharacterized protein LOC135946939 [Cloeon dipterum]|uniref:uncharacterized protein LOC135946939 n=1 Tax=Cloeon dipterum TaxID=197152 RepID=UPI00321FC621
MGYAEADGAHFETCGRRYVVSKAAMNASSAAVFCCSKIMDLAAVETENEMNCLFSVLTKRSLDKIQMWTSGDSEPCENSFAWCSSQEMVDQEVLKWSAPSEDGKKSKILVSVGAKSLEFRPESDKVYKRVLCESALKNNCKDSRCFQYKCSFEKDYMQLMAKGKRDIGEKDRRRFSGCGMAMIGVCIAVFKYSFHGSYKVCCSNNSRLLSIETKEKSDCLQDLFRINNVPPNRYWIGGASLGCPSVNRWCNGKDEPLIGGGHVTWAKDEPSNDSEKECVYADYDNVTSKFTLGKINCKTSLLFICEQEFRK